MLVFRRFGASLVVVALLTAACQHSRAPLVPAEPAKTTIPVGAEPMPPDPALVELMKPYEAEVAKLANPIGTSAAEMPLGSMTPALGCWIADIMLERANALGAPPVDAAFTNLGGIRSAFPKGAVSYKTIAQILPFDNTLVLITMSGEELRRTAEHLAGKKGIDPIAGMTIEAADDKTLEQVIVGGKPLDPGGAYTVATNNFLSSGGGDMEFLRDYRQVDTGVMLRDAVADKVRELTAAGRQVEPPADIHRYHFGGKNVEELP